MNWTYISGPVTGDPDYFKHFWAAETYLKHYRDATPMNPVKTNATLPESADWETYMDVSMVLLEHCSAIALMPGWTESRGANREYGYALGKGLDIIYLDEDMLELGFQKAMTDEITRLKKSAEEDEGGNCEV